MPPHRSQADRSQMLTAFRSSGMTQHAFAKVHGINVNTLRAWIYAERHGRPAVPAATFLEVRTPNDPDEAQPFLLQIGSGPVLHFAAPPDPKWLAQLVAAHPC